MTRRGPEGAGLIIISEIRPETYFTGLSDAP